MIDDLQTHMNEEKDSDLGVRDLIKLKKRLFEPEIRIIEERFTALVRDL